MRRVDDELVERPRTNPMDRLAHRAPGVRPHAERAVERQVKALLKLFDAEVTIRWADRTPASIAQQDIELGERVREALEAGGSPAE